MPRWRLGVALLFPGHVANEINGLRRALGDGSLERIAPHITLVPPVNVRVEDVSSALALMRKVADHTAPFTVELGAISSFRPSSPTLKLDVAGVGVGAVRELRNAIFVPPLERSLTFDFVPHVTVADELDDARSDAAIAALQGATYRVGIDRLWLLREGERRIWSPIADVAFGEPTVVGRGGMEVVLRTTALIDPMVATTFDDIDRYDEVVTAWVGDEAVGLIAWRHDGTWRTVVKLQVAERHRGLGIGTHLARAVLDDVGGPVRVPRPLTAFFRRFGFDQQGLRVSTGEF